MYQPRQITPDLGGIPMGNYAPEMSRIPAMDLMRVPPGAVIYTAASSAPDGWLKCNGAAVSRTSYELLFAVIGTTYGAGDGATTFNLPELRGEFIRSLDDGRGVDAARALGSAQADELKSHLHTIPISTSTNYGYSGAGGVGGGTTNTGNTGGTETRPRNVALLACIKY